MIKGEIYKNVYARAYFNSNSCLNFVNGFRTNRFLAKHKTCNVLAWMQTKCPQKEGIHRCSEKRLFWKILQNSQETPVPKSLFVIVQGVFLWILTNFFEKLFYGTHPDDYFWNWQCLLVFQFSVFLIWASEMLSSCLGLVDLFPIRLFSNLQHVNLSLSFWIFSKFIREQFDSNKF